jgi:hypothetical protein
VPTVLREGGYQIMIFTSDHPPPHVHVRHAGRLAKVNLEPVSFTRTGGLNAGEQSEILQVVQANQSFLLAEWDRLYPPEEIENDE